MKVVVIDTHLLADHSEDIEKHVMHSGSKLRYSMGLFIICTSKTIAQGLHLSPEKSGFSNFTLFRQNDV